MVNAKLNMYNKKRNREVYSIVYIAILVKQYCSNNNGIPLSEIKPIAFYVCICAYLKIHYELLSWQRPRYIWENVLPI